MEFAICKEECGSLTTTLYKNRRYRYEYLDDIQIKVYNEVGVYVIFYGLDFTEYFYTEKELRKEKLKKINTL